MNYRECYETGKRILIAAQIPEAQLDARLLLEFVCGTDQNDLLAHGDRQVPPEKQDTFFDLLAKRGKHIPLQQLTGSQNFMGLDFAVNDRVLIPRQDTEILVEEVLKNLHDGMRILDLCTGTGCILISLLHYSNGCTGVGTDLSPEALRIARRNAERLLADGEMTAAERAVFLQGDLLEPVKGRFDLIAANPPYIPTGAIPGLMPEVREHEPLAALDGGKDGLDFYRRILPESRAYLVRGGSLYLEIGYDQGQAVKTFMEDWGFREVEIVQDYAGLDRVVYGSFWD